jgi:plastocyanin
VRVATKGMRRGAVAAMVAAAVAVAGVALLPTGALALKRKIVGTCTGPSCVWTPRSRTVARGTKIVWKVPAGDVAHTVTAYRSNSKKWVKNVTIRPGQKTSKVFKKRGLYRFKCRFHPAMKGSIRVT